MFPKVTFTLGDSTPAKQFTIECHNLSGQNIYIQGAELNGKEYNRSRLPVEAITAGGTLDLYMGSSPNTLWGTDEE